ncbi:MAG: nucleotidyltransferase [Sulfolobales archaeon]
MALSKMIDMLRAKGVDGVIIGSTSIELALKRDRFEGDIDLLVTSRSVLANYGVLEEVARSYGCTLGSTWLGTPSITCFINDEEVTADLYENMHDFYIPDEIVEDAIEYQVHGTRVKAVRPEDYVVLKAAAGRGEDLEALRKIGEAIRKRELKIDKRLVELRAELFSEKKSILRRLSEYLW